MSQRVNKIIAHILVFCDYFFFFVLSLVLEVEQSIRVCIIHIIIIPPNAVQVMSDTMDSANVRR